VEEVEQVRQGFGFEQGQFLPARPLLGRHFGLPSMRLKYQDNLKGLIISNMMMSCPRLRQSMPMRYWPSRWILPVLAEVRAIEAKGDFSNPRYMELLMPHFYNQHICRIPLG
jgi:proline iminopeptidase